MSRVRVLPGALAILTACLAGIPSAEGSALPTSASRAGAIEAAVAGLHGWEATTAAAHAGLVGASAAALAEQITVETANLHVAARLIETLQGRPSTHLDQRLPSTAIAALLARHGVTADPSVTARLDRLAPPTRSALAAVIEAFDRLEGLLASRERTPAQYQIALAAREDLVVAGVALRDALHTDPQMTEPIRFPPIFSIDLAAAANTYTDFFMLLIDAGGNDVYRNNAGGGCSILNAALLDLGGADRYEGKESCGSNGGGGLGGSGFLLDLGGGRDIYAPTGTNTIPADCGGIRCASNGGGYFGDGFLVDDGGNDSYTTYGDGANGGAADATGRGFLLDAAGNDVYRAGANGTNGGASNGGTGFLVDVQGTDTYTATFSGTNGGAAAGVGVLLDGGGPDVYTAGGGATNGGGHLGLGLLVDAAGNDRYTAGSSGTNGGGALAGHGTLVDLAGADIYTAGGAGTNGGAGVEAGSGLLLDLGGNDRYTAGANGVNGGGSTGTMTDDVGLGLLVDKGGTDVYLDQNGGSGTDKTVVPKGRAGAQVDQA